MITKKLIAIFFVALLLLPLKSSAVDAPQIGHAPFAIAHKKFNCSAFLDSIKNQDTINIAWLYNTFGKHYTCLNKVLDDPRLNYIETHLLNGPGHRNRRLENHEFLKKYTPKQWDSLLRKNDKRLKSKFLRYVRSLQNVLARKKDTATCLISPELEANISSSAAKTLISWSKEAFPQCLIVWNPITRNKSLNGADYLEQHGKNPAVKAPMCVINLDGTDINFKERLAPNKKYYRKGLKNWIEADDLKTYLQKYASKCQVVFIWVFEYNCIDINNSPSKFIYPTRRACNQVKVFKLIEKEVNKL